MSKIMSELQSQRAGETDAETYERAVRDPEVAEILNDPVMRQLLSDSQQDPRALQDHMKNPMVSPIKFHLARTAADNGADCWKDTEIDQCWCY